MSIDALLRHLEEDAGREATRLREEADTRAAEIVARAEADAARQRVVYLERVVERRRTEHERQLAAARVQARGQFLQVRLEVLDRVFEGASSLLTRMPIDRYAESVGTLAAGAARYLEGSPAMLQCPPDAVAAVRTAMQHLLNLSVAPADVPAGVTGRSADGRVLVENTLAAILARHRPEMAIGLAARIEEG